MIQNTYKQLITIEYVYILYIYTFVVKLACMKESASKTNLGGEETSKLVDPKPILWDVWGADFR